MVCATVGYSLVCLALPELGLPGMWDDESALSTPGGRLHRRQIAWSAGLLALKGAGWPGPGYVCPILVRSFALSCFLDQSLTTLRCLSYFLTFVRLIGL